MSLRGFTEGKKFKRKKKAFASRMEALVFAVESEWICFLWVFLGGGELGVLGLFGVNVWFDGHIERQVFRWMFFTMDVVLRLGVASYRKWRGNGCCVSRRSTETL